MLRYDFQDNLVDIEQLGIKGDLTYRLKQLDENERGIGEEVNENIEGNSSLDEDDDQQLSFWNAKHDAIDRSNADVIRLFAQKITRKVAGLEEEGKYIGHYYTDKVTKQKVMEGEGTFTNTKTGEVIKGWFRDGMKTNRCKVTSIDPATNNRTELDCDFRHDMKFGEGSLKVLN